MIRREDRGQKETNRTCQEDIILIAIPRIPSQIRTTKKGSSENHAKKSILELPGAEPEEIPQETKVIDRDEMPWKK